MLLVYGPFDRFNYGDLLFPYILEKELRDKYSAIEFIAIRKSDLHRVGGKATRPFKDLYQLDSSKNYNLVIAGGESLITTWGDLFSYFSIWYNRLSIFWRGLNKIFGKRRSKKINNQVARFLLSGKTQLPFCVSKFDYKFIDKVFYNSLGGSTLNEETFTMYSSLLSTLKNVDYLAVREAKSYEILMKKNIEVSLVPDSVILISKHYPVEKLKLLISPEVCKYHTEVEKYCVFQINKALGWKYKAEAAKQLENIYHNMGLNIVLCPMGFAYGHEDPSGLHELSKELSVPHKYFKSLSIWDITYLLACSSLYIGSSLHGAIVSMSYFVPYIGFEVKKVDWYLRTWAPDYLDHIVPVKSISSTAIEILDYHKAVLVENCKYQQNLVEKSLSKMC